MPKFILKQLGDAPKSVNHAAKFDDNYDLILHLEDLKKKWNEAEYGKLEFQLMEMVDGIELAASAFFNGTDFLRNPDGSIAGFLNNENKKEAVGDTGETTGEMGTLFYGCDKKSKVLSKILGSPEIIKTLKESGFRGVFDINGSLQKDGSYVGFEPTCRFGVPASSYEFIEGLESPLGELIEGVARGFNVPVKVKGGYGMVTVVAAKPFPIEVDLDDEGTSVGEILYPLENGKPISDFTPEQRKHLHPYNFYVNKDGRLEVATKSGYLYTVTSMGKTISEARDNGLKFVKESTYISGMKYRTDLSKKFEEAMGQIK